jgi:hypothetical protein
VQLFVPGPVLVQMAFGSQPPWPMLHESTAVQVVPVPAYPVWQAHVFVAGPVLVHAALASQPPLFTKQLSIGAQLRPAPA